MLNSTAFDRRRVAGSAQRGVVLLLALILLLAMTVAGIALVRSVYSTNVVAGNLAFRHAATNSADIGVETAVAWLEANNATNALDTSVLSGSGVRYVAHRQDPGTTQSWDDFWTTIPTSAVNSLAADASGNTVQFVIHRLCNADGNVASVACSAAPNGSGTDVNTKSAPTNGMPPLANIPQVYYRITARVSGPRNTLSYVQVVVAM